MQVTRRRWAIIAEAGLVSADSRARPGESGTIEAMHVAAEKQPRPGQPRSEGDAAFLKRYDARMQLPILVSAILPLIVVPEGDGWVGVVIGLVTWLVFLADYVVHARHLDHYRHTGIGRFDLFVVIATAPWFLFPGTQAGQFVVVLRLARLARLVMASKGARRLFQRLGRVAGVAGGVLIIASLVAYHAEHPTNPEFATVGDALWWGIVTLTTVGYGDIVPKTPTGRWAAVVIMITGIAVLGVLAGSLASFFRLDEGAPATGSPTAGEPASTATTTSDGALEILAAEVSALRRQVEDLAAWLTRAPPSSAPQDPAADDDPPD